MRYKVIKIIDDGVIAARKGRITCFVENSLRSQLNELEIRTGVEFSGEEALYAETYWSYSKSQWNALNNGFQDIYPSVGKKK